MAFSKLPQLAWFTLIAEHRSLTKAAAELGVSRAALSQSLKALEQQLNVKLIYRTTRSMSLSEEGRQLYELLRPAFSTIKQAVHSVNDASATPSGILRINTSRVAARLLIEPYMLELFSRHPKLKLEFIMDDGHANIIAEGCDAGIRLGHALPPHMVAVPVSPPLQLVVAASARYIERHGAPRTLADLSTHNCIGYRDAVTGAVQPWGFDEPGQAAQAFSIEPQGSLISNDDDCLVRAALSGLGIIQHLDLALAPHLASGALVRLLPQWSRPFPGYYMYAPSRDKMPSKVRALMTFLTEKRDAG